MNANIAMARQKIIVIEDRRFQVSKYPAETGMIIAKVIMAKIIPVAKGVMPIISQFLSSNGVVKDDIFSDFEKYVDLEGIAKALDLVSPEDLKFIIRSSLMSCHEILPAGQAPVMNANGTYGVQNVEHDILIVLRLTCETLMFGVSDFFDGDRLTSIMGPLFSTLQPSQPTSNTTFTPPFTPATGASTN